MIWIRILLNLDPHFAVSGSAVEINQDADPENEILSNLVLNISTSLTFLPLDL